MNIFNFHLRQHLKGIFLRSKYIDKLTAEQITKCADYFSNRKLNEIIPIKTVYKLLGGKIKSENLRLDLICKKIHKKRADIDVIWYGKKVLLIICHPLKKVEYTSEFIASLTESQYKKCAEYISYLNIGTIVTVEELSDLIGEKFDYKSLDLNLICKELHILNSDFNVIWYTQNKLKIISTNINKEYDLKILSQKNIIDKKTEIRNEPSPKPLSSYCKTLKLENEETKEDRLYKVIISSICAKLEKMNLYDRLYSDELELLYPLLKKRPAKVSDINSILHKINKEVTYLNGYFILCEMGHHEQRMKDLEAIRYNIPILYKPEGYRDDISNNSGTFHLPREFNGRIASGIDEDSYD